MSEQREPGFWRDVEDLLGPEFTDKAEKSAAGAILAAEDLAKDPIAKKAGYGAAGGIKGGAAAKAVLSKGVLGKVIGGAVLAKASPVIILGVAAGCAITGALKGEKIHETITRTSANIKSWKDAERAKRDGLTP